jgi:hypothetical protein
MTGMTETGGFPARRDADRNAFLIFVGLVWVGVLTGFGTDSFNHISQHGLDYPWIVHIHAVAFVGWLVIFTVQAAFIRAGNVAQHRRLGLAAIALGAFMIVIGPATALYRDAQVFHATGQPPVFLAAQFTDILAFATLTGAGLLLRRNAAAHKRLMLMGLIYISDAGFARFLNVFAAEPMGEGFWADMTALYLGSNILLLGLGAYDLVTRRRLHPAYVIGMVWVVALELTAWSLLYSDQWKTISLHLIGQ